MKTLALFSHGERVNVSLMIGGESVVVCLPQASTEILLA